MIMPTQESAPSVVVGAGPAGIAVVSHLIVNNKNNNKIVWIDLDWQGGYLKNVPNVPSNTNVALFIKYASAMGLTLENSPALQKMHGLPADAGCKLEHAYAIILDCLALLKPQVSMCITGKVESVIKHSSNEWVVLLEGGQDVPAQRVFMCQGARHRKLAAVDPDKILNFEDVLNGRNMGLTKEKKTVAVLGTSHSGMLAVKNLVEHGHIPHCHIFYKNTPQLIYAKVIRDDLILNDNTGLKGIVATWCRTHFGDQLGDFCIQGTQITCRSVSLFSSADYDGVVSAIGFEPNPIRIPPIPKDNTWGQLDPDGLYGFGIAYPELMAKVITAENMESDKTASAAVGFWKFVKTIRKVLASTNHDCD